MEQDLERRIQELEQKLEEFTNPATMSEQFLVNLVKLGFLRVKTILQYTSASNTTFRTLFLDHNDSSTALTGFDKGYYVQFSASTSDTCTSNGHSLQNDDQVFLISTGDLPTPLVNSIPYYVINSSTNTFKLSTSIGGASVNITDVGAGTHYLQQQ